MSGKTGSDRTRLGNGSQGQALRQTNATRGQPLRNELAGVSGRIEELTKAMALPEVAEDGSSECPWAQSLYAKKEELEKQVGREVERLTRYVPVLEQEIQRQKRNLQQIQTDSGKLSLPETTQRYSEAARAQRSQLQSAIDDKDAIAIVLAKAQAVLDVSRTRTLPRKIAREPQSSGAGPLGPGESTGIQAPPAPWGDELDGLVSLGPLGRTSLKERPHEAGRPEGAAGG